MRIVVLLLACLLLQTATAVAAEVPYLGMSNSVNEDPPGLLVYVVPGAPAANAGIRTGDVVIAVDGRRMADAAGADYAALLKSALESRQVGETMSFIVYRSNPDIVLQDANGNSLPDYPLEELQARIAELENGQQLSLTASRNPRELTIDVLLAQRPDRIGIGAAIPANVDLRCDVDYIRQSLPDFIDRLAENSGIAADCDDLFSRLDRRASADDGYRFERSAYLLRNALKGEAVTRNLTGKLAEAMTAGISGYSQIQYSAAETMDIYDLEFPILPDDKGGNLEDDLQLLAETIEAADALIGKAFSAYSEEELAFLDAQRSELTYAFKQWHYIDSEDENTRRVDDNLRLLELARKLDYRSLQQAQLLLSSIAQVNFLTRLEQELRSEYADNLDDDELLRRETGAGDIVVNGTGRSWQRKDDAVCRIDLGGDDFYTNAAGSATGVDHRLGILIEFGGNDAYESTRHHAQGSGSMGCGMLIDMAGNDQYIGLQWAQGCAFLGSGVLIDYAGDDVYRGEELCQAAAIFGSAILFDISGNDRIEGQMKCQAFGGAHGVGLLLDAGGDDYRYAKGKYKTNYGDDGIFDSWSQGCAQGFRNRASGGIAGIVDLGGSDYNEAGNFSQGGGYYFGYGFFHDIGSEGDHYIGSRYNQGFCAHQAVGVFLEEGGNDLYQTRQGVAQGLAWDEAGTMFIDYGGDDRYEGGGSFSQGASAHNAVCVMWDMRGNDVYDYPSGQGRTSGNTYHGGTSLSLFLDTGGGEDSYNSGDGENNKVTGWPEYGFFADLPASLGLALEDGKWLEYWVETAED